MDLCDSSTDGFMDTTALTKTIAFSFKGINFDEKILLKEVFYRIQDRKSSFSNFDILEKKLRYM